MSENEHNPIYGDPNPFEVLIAHFESHELRYGSNREEKRAWMSMNSGNALMKCRFKFDKTGDIFMIHVQYPVLVQQEFRAIAMEYLSRANWGLVLGGFDFDNSDGEVSFRVSYLMPDGKLEDEAIHKLFNTALSTADRYFPGLMQCIYSGYTAEDAIFHAEIESRIDMVEDSPKKSGKPSRKGKKASRKGARKSSDQNEEGTNETNPSMDTGAAIPPIPPPAQTEQHSADQGADGEQPKAA